METTIYTESAKKATDFFDVQGRKTLDINLHIA